MTRKPWTVGKFSGEGVQQYVRLMTGRQRKLWARDKYPRDLGSLESFCSFAGQRRFFAKDRPKYHAENIARGREWRRLQFKRACKRLTHIKVFGEGGIEPIPLDSWGKRILRRRMVGRHG